MKKIIISLFLILQISPSKQKEAENPYKKYVENLPFEMPEIEPPTFPDYSVNIKDFGAIGDGKFLCTESFKNAIEELSSKEGGILIVPAGVWLTGPIELKSNINLHLEMGAVIQFSGDDALFPIIKASFEGLETFRCQSPLSATNATNIAVTGNGVIDGNGQYWRPVKRAKVTDNQWNEILKRPGGVVSKKDYWVPNEGYAKAEEKANMNVVIAETEEEWIEYKRFLRPVMVNFINCKNIYLQGVIFQNSPAWNIHPLMCENIILEDVLVRNPYYAQNGDALDLDSCKNALIINSKFDAGDDGICIKSGKDEDGRKRNMPCQNIVVDGCTVFAGHGGFVVGSEMSGGVKNIKVQNCQFLGTDVGLRFKSTRGRGGVVENIFIDQISMMDIKNDAITFSMFYGSSNAVQEYEDEDLMNNLSKIKADETTPVFRNINIENIICNGAGRAMEFNGLPEMPIDGIYLNNVNIVAKSGAEFNNAKNIIKNNVNITII